MKELNELIYTQCFGRLYCDFRGDMCNGYRVVIDGLFDGEFCADNDEQAIQIFKDGRYSSRKEAEARWKTANILYNMGLDMDYADYSDFYYEEIDNIAEDLARLSDATRGYLARIADMHSEYFDSFRPEIDA